MTLPTIVTSSVIRGSDKGDSHGGVYLIDLEREQSAQVLDWNTTEIDWEGRGGDRGLRGIAIYKDRLYMAASDEIFVFDTRFSLMRSIKHPLLKHCHEIHRDGSKLYITSTGFNAILILDLEQEKFLRGYRFGFGSFAVRLYIWGISLTPTWEKMDLDAPEKYSLVAEDSLHINHVFIQDKQIYFSGTRVQHLFAFDGEDVRIHGRVPKGAHNAQPLGENTLLNDTANNRLAIIASNGAVMEEYPVHKYEQAELNSDGLPPRVARQGFARGLVLTDEEVFIVGSSPATINVFHRGQKKAKKTINLSMDLRNAIHGLEIWPFESDFAFSGR